MSEEHRYLYRGISERLYMSSAAGLKPKRPGPFVHGFRADGTVPADGSATAGPSERNAILRHELRQEGFGSCGVSTTPFFERARHYAIGQCKLENGRVLKIDRMLLKEYGVREYVVADRVPHPSVPEDYEIILIAEDEGVLPYQIVVEEIAVEP
jgi:hypothetical protein